MEYEGVVPVVPVQGGGDDAPKVAHSIAELGYRTAFLGDSDKEIKPNEAELVKSGVNVIRWADKQCIEQRICIDIPWSALQQLIELCISVVGEYVGQEVATASVLDAIGAKLNLVSGSLKSTDPNLWIDAAKDQQSIRAAVGIATAKKGWFKKVEYGKRLGEFVVSIINQIPPTTDLSTKIMVLKEWVYA
jgi:hypothetical protein